MPITERVRHQREQDPDLSALADAARRGSGPAFAALAQRVTERVRRWASLVTRDHDDAEDVTQLVLLRLHAHIARFEGRSQLSTWLYRITRNVALNRVRREQRRHALLAGHVRAIAEPEVVEPAGLAQPSVDDLARLVRYYLHTLPARQREVFELADLQGLRSPEIARRLGITPATARGLLMKARRRIRVRILEAHPHLLEDFRP